MANNKFKLFGFHINFRITGDCDIVDIWCSEQEAKTSNGNVLNQVSHEGKPAGKYRFCNEPDLGKVLSDISKGYVSLDIYSKQNTPNQYIAKLLDAVYYLRDDYARMIQMLEFGDLNRFYGYGLIGLSATLTHTGINLNIELLDTVFHQGIYYKKAMAKYNLDANTNTALKYQKHQICSARDLKEAKVINHFNTSEYRHKIIVYCNNLESELIKGVGNIELYLRNVLNKFDFAIAEIKSVEDWKERFIELRQKQYQE